MFFRDVGFDGRFEKGRLKRRVMDKKKYTDLQLYKRLLNHARPYSLHIVGIFLLSLLSTPLTLLAPVPLKIAVDSVLGSQALPWFLAPIVPTSFVDSNKSLLIFTCVLQVFIVLLSELRERGSELFRIYTGEKLVQNLRVDLFKHIQRLSLSYHDTKGMADSIYRIQYDAPSIQYIAIDGVIPFITSAFTLISMIYVISRLDAQLALIALAVSPIIFFSARKFRKRLRKKSRELKKIERFTLSAVQEVLGAIRVVKAFGREKFEQKRFTFRSTKGVEARVQLTQDEGKLSLLLNLTTAVGTAAVLYVGVTHVQTGTLSLGELLLVMGYLSQLYAPVVTISRKIASLQSHLAGAERVFSVLDEEPEVVDRPDAQPLLRAEGEVEFRNVSFSFGKDRPVLKDVSFKVPPRSRVGIVGTTGSGKTTLISLLTRFYDPTEGMILMDGVDLRDYKLADLRNQFSIVLQEPVLFSTTIGANIAYTRPMASLEEIIEAAKAANAHEFITDLPGGYDTKVGERGMQLSGGQRQRISLARAFFKNSPILILDEPTSAVDVKTEAEIMEALQRLMQNRTTFMIAHRLSTLADCDVRLEIEDGRLIPSDTLAFEDIPAVAEEAKPGTEKNRNA
jgi:ATP-binding cassette, subfamily B, bacterial